MQKNSTIKQVPNPFFSQSSSSNSQEIPKSSSELQAPLSPKKKKPKPTSQTSLNQPSSIKKETRLYISYNLKALKAEEIADIFCEFGEIQNIFFGKLNSRKMKRKKPFFYVFISFVDPEVAENLANKAQFTTESGITFKIKFMGNKPKKMKKKKVISAKMKNVNEEEVIFNPFVRDSKEPENPEKQGLLEPSCNCEWCSSALKLSQIRPKNINEEQLENSNPVYSARVKTILLVRHKCLNLLSYNTLKYNNNYKVRR